MKKMLTALAILNAALALPAVAGDVTIGAAFPMSGANAEYGQVFGGGVDLAIAHVNADKKLSGKLGVVYEDSQALPAQGVIAANKLINVNKVPFVLSAFTGVSKAIAPIGARTRTVMVNGGGVGPDLATLGEYFWNTIPLANFEVRTIVPYLVKEKGYKRIALVYVDDPLGQAILTDLGSALQKIHPRQSNYISFITGPSRTADIERVLTIGVHGPERLIIVVVDGLQEVSA